MVNAACAGFRPEPDFDPGEARAATPVPGTPLTRLWASRPVRGPSAPIAVDSVNAYLGGSDRRVVAVDLRTGRTRWAHRVAGPLVGGVLVSGAVVYASTDRPEGQVHAFSVTSGNELWSVRLGYMQAPLALVDGRLLASTRDGQLVALDPASGKIQWRRRLLPARAAPLDLGAGEVMVTSYDSLYRIRLKDGSIARRRHALGTVVSPWIRVGPSLVAATGDSLVVGLDPDSLTERWRVRVDGPVLTSPAARGDTLYVVTLAGAIFRVRTDSIRSDSMVRPAGWAATGAPAVLGDWLLAGASDGALRAFSLQDGGDAWTVPLGRPLELAPVLLADGSFLVLGGRGDLHRMRP